MNKSMLLFALKMIRSECHKHNDCTGCPFSLNDNTCGIRQDVPSEWDLLDDEPCDEQLIF